MLPEFSNHLPCGWVERTSGEVLDLQLGCGSGTEGVCYREENSLGSRKQLLCSSRADLVSESAKTFSFSTAPQAPVSGKHRRCLGRAKHSLSQRILIMFLPFHLCFLTLKGLSKEAPLASFCLSAFVASPKAPGRCWGVLREGL